MLTSAPRMKLMLRATRNSARSSARACTEERHESAVSGEFVSTDHEVAHEDGRNDGHEAEDRDKGAKESASAQPTGSPGRQRDEADHSRQRDGHERNEEASIPMPGHHNDQADT